MQLWRPCIPITDSVESACLVDLEVAGGTSGSLQHCARLRLAGDALGVEFAFGQRLDEFKLLGEAQHGPGQAARPGCEGRIALLRRWAAKGATGGIEDGFMRRASAKIGHIIVFASFAVVDVVCRRSLRVRQQSAQQIDALVLLAYESVTEQVRHSADAKCADSIDEQGVAGIAGGG